MRTTIRCTSRGSATASRFSVLTSNKMNVTSTPHCWARCASGTETEDIKVPPLRTYVNNSLSLLLPTVWIAVSKVPRRHCAPKRNRDHLVDAQPLRFIPVSIWPGH
jgi:hypothetical protein